MNGFITNSGTRYYVDMVNKEFKGGRYKKPVQWFQFTALIGQHAIFYCQSREEPIKLGVVRSYF